jgi:ABC-2 type transport system ATP-binding protein
VHAVEVDGLVKRYAGRTVVDGLSFTVAEGELLALLGPNGAGKTTTVETCEGFRTPDAGTVRVLGLDPARDRRALTAQVGVMLQSGGIPPGASPDEVLALYASFFSAPRSPADLVSSLGLDEVRRTPFRHLSGGQQQRVSLAVALVGRPRLVFLDEPTAGLDPQARLATWDLVAALKADGVTVVLTTHVMDEAERLADTVVIIDNGRIVASGSPADLTTAGRDSALRFRATAGLPLDQLRTALPQGLVAAEPTPGVYVVEGPIDPQVFGTVSSWCATHGVIPQDLRTGSRTLEDVFLDLTGKDLRA